jgi:DNA modification methylase
MRGRVIHHGDCLEVMAAMDPESVDAIVTDPPYGLGFMGKHWDHGVPNVDFWRAMFRVARPSSYLLSFGGTRTVHRIATNIEDAGWVIRDMLVWAYASGFPKSRASLKPAWEPIVMARKPGPLRMLAIDECRIPPNEADREAWSSAGGYMVADSTVIRSEFADITQGHKRKTGVDQKAAEFGRWPANVILTDPIFDGGIEGVVGGGEAASTIGVGASNDPWLGGGRWSEANTYGDSGTYSRFFLVPKAARSDREPVLGGLPGTKRQNVHPTVKPTELMRHLVRLVTPTGGVVLDPFLGSGTTGLAAEMEGFEWVGIEREEEYVRIAEARLNGTQRGLGLGLEA